MTLQQSLASLSAHYVRDDSPGIFGDARHLLGDRHQRRQGLLQRNPVLRRISHVALKIDAQGGALGAGTRQPENDARSVVEQNPDALLLATRSVDRIDVTEIVGRLDRKSV